MRITKFIDVNDTMREVHNKEGGEPIYIHIDTKGYMNEIVERLLIAIRDNMGATKASFEGMNTMGQFNSRVEEIQNPDYEPGSVHAGMIRGNTRNDLVKIDDIVYPLVCFCSDGVLLYKIVPTTTINSSEEENNSGETNIMKLNSNTIVFKKESSDFQNLEKHLKRIAAENNITDVSEINIKVSKDQSLIKFKKAILINKEKSVEEDDDSGLLSDDELDAYVDNQETFGEQRYFLFTSTEGNKFFAPEEFDQSELIEFNPNTKQTNTYKQVKYDQIKHYPPVLDKMTPIGEIPNGTFGVGAKLYKNKNLIYYFDNDDYSTGGTYFTFITYKLV